MATTDQQPWGRVDETGTVFVREGEGERAVGQYPDGTAEEALAYFERKYTDLAGQVTLLEQRARRGAPAADIAKAVASLRAERRRRERGRRPRRPRRPARQARRRRSTNSPSSSPPRRRPQVEQAIAERTAIVVEAEDARRRRSGEDAVEADHRPLSTPSSPAGRRTSTTGRACPRTRPTSCGSGSAPPATTIEQQPQGLLRRARQRCTATSATRKQQLIEQAEALIPKGVDGIPEYRQLLDEWKLAGRAGKKQRRRPVGAVQGGRRRALRREGRGRRRDNEEFTGNLELKLALLDEAEPLLTETDRETARADTALASSSRWDEIGKVPRDQVRVVEDRLRKVETAVRKLDEEHWERNNPETKARSEGLASQLNDAIAKLEHELEEAKASGDAAKVKEAQEALDARKVWLTLCG